MGSVIRTLVLAVALCAAASSAYAHRLHAGLTDISVNATTGELEVVHRLYTHDLHPAIGFNAIDDAELYETREGLLRLGAYAAARFSMRVEGEGPSPLRYVGAEPDGEFTFFYFVGDAPESGDSVIIDNRLLVDFHPSQSNLTNIRLGEDVQSLTQGPDSRAPGRARF
ncbi:DUF6702 family protein [Oceanicaulis alexandrii]|uniref:DUF6702 family protein n=1 Tax=Oceanicaulis alexandrii TaxID=153233 RepID=UPI0023556354|nr:DUF6702 family protein [Oceanicaulis alexandrii]